MHHLKIYESIIQKVKAENRIKHNGVYYENHHVIPKCLHGNNDKENLVLLTAREHYICHKLLTYIYKGNRKITCALHMMTYSRNGNFVKSSRDYKFIRELLSKNSKGENHPMFGKKHSLESIEKMRKSHKKYSQDYLIKLKEMRKGENNPMFGKSQSKEAKEKNKKAHQGKTHSKESKEKMSKIKMNHNVSLKTRQKQSEWQKGKTYEELYGFEKATRMKEKQRQKKLQKNRSV